MEAIAAAIERRSDVIDLLAEADDWSSAREALMSALGIDAGQAEAVMNLRLGRLTEGERQRIDAELSDLRAALEGD